MNDEEFDEFWYKLTESPISNELCIPPEQIKIPQLPDMKKMKETLHMLLWRWLPVYRWVRTSNYQYFLYIGNGYKKATTRIEVLVQGICDFFGDHVIPILLPKTCVHTHIEEQKNQHSLTLRINGNDKPNIYGNEIGIYFENNDAGILCHIFDDKSSHKNYIWLHKK